MKIMVSTYFILISILLAATEVQGQCPLDSCSLITQVNICTNETATSGGCPTDSQCVMALRENSTVEECCNKIVQSIINAPTSGQNGDCVDQTEFGDILNLVNTAESKGEIHAGTYIVLQRGRKFVYSCNGCIKSIQLAVSRTSVLTDSQGQERIKFHTFASRTGDKSIVQSVEDVTEWSSSVMMTTGDRQVFEYRPISPTEVCFSQGDVFGFTIEAGSGIALLTRFPSDTSDVVLNASSTSQTISGCPQLNNSGLYTNVGSFRLTPLIHIVTGGFLPMEPPLKTAEPPRTEPTTQTDTRTTATTPPNPPPPTSTVDTGAPSPRDSGYAVYAAGGFAGAICILLIVVIIVVVICIVQKRKHRSYQYGNGFKFGSSIPGADGKNNGVAVTAFSPRMSNFIDPSPDKDIITIENTLADPSESLMHHYDLPSELISADNIHRMPWTDMPRQKNYVNMHTAASSVSGSISQISKTYDSAPELGTTPLLKRHGGTVKNPLYQETGLQEPTYHNPEELNVHQMKRLGTLGTSFEDDGIYTETGTVGSMGTPPTPLSLDNDSHYSPPPDEFDNVTTFNPYHELLPGEVDEETGHHYFLIEKDKELENSLQVGSLGRHRVYEPGLYVPDAEERKRMSVRRGENPGSIYEIFEEVATHIFDDNYINMTPQQFLNDIILPVQIIIETLKTQQKEKEILQRRGSFLEPRSRIFSPIDLVK